MRRIWAMPSHNTFGIKPIKKFIEEHITSGLWIDPFSSNSPFAKQCITNDLNNELETDYHMEALDFLKKFDNVSVDGVLFDPPYSPRQISECYKQVGREVHMKDTQSSFYGDRKKEIARIVKPGGKVLCFGWNSGGIGKSNKFKLIDLLLVPHGGAHNDTICTAEIKLN
ncbi:MAG: adenine-specific DNA methylase [Bacteroidota bacterium]